MTDARPLIAGNWKMNLDADQAGDLARAIASEARGLENARLALFPPFVWIPTVKTCLGDAGVSVGGQDCHAAESGAHTGEISAPMLRAAGCDMVLVGHSERRADHLETDAQVRRKSEAALAGGLTPIVCVGETLKQRESGKALAVVATQINGSVPEGAKSADLIIAYEPVWAIGAGRVPTLGDIADMHESIAETASARLSGGPPQILYGGSVKPDNAADILGCPLVGGALVGGASLSAKSFLAIARAAPQG